MKGDKKSIDGQIRFVLLNEIGSPQIYELSEEEILVALKDFSK
jgi:3-dehydroquinate synthetase